MMVPPEEDPLYIKQTELDSRVARVERVIDSEGLVNLLKQIEQLQKENQALREQVDQLQFKLDQAGDRPEAAVPGRRPAAAEPGEGAWGTSAPPARMRAASSMAASCGPAQLPVPGGTDRANYQAAFELLKQGRYKEASAALTPVHDRVSRTARCPTTPSTGSPRPTTSARPTTRPCRSSRWWSTSTRKSRKIPDALLKIGYCNYELKRFDAARKSLQAVVANYPETTAARLAGQRLERMTSEGL